VLCVVKGKGSAKVGRAMAAAFAGHKIKSRVFALYADNAGLKITSRKR
jgi:hypothetical protein